MKKVALLVLFFSSIISNAQEKRLWAKSFINEKAPEFVVEQWLSKEPDTSGKFVLIEFWATWCGACKRSIPKLNSFHKEFKDDLVVIGISNEPANKVRTQTNPKIEYFSAIDTKDQLKKIYGVHGIPHCVLINPAGIVVWEGFPNLKGFELTSEVIRNILDDK